MCRARSLGRCGSQASSFRGSRCPAAFGECRPPNRGGKAPTSADAERRIRWLSLAAKPVPSAEGNSRSMTRTGAPIGASPRRFSLSPGTAFWKRTGAADRRNALDSAGFPRVHPFPPARCRTGPHSWARRCLPRPPEARLARPNPQAPHPSPFACAS